MQNAANLSDNWKKDTGKKMSDGVTVYWSNGVVMLRITVGSKIKETKHP